MSEDTKQPATKQDETEYDSNRTCAECGMASPRSVICGECEVANRFCKQIDALTERAEKADAQLADATAEIQRHVEDRNAALRERHEAQIRAEKAERDLHVLLEDRRLHQRDALLVQLRAAKAREEKLRALWSELRGNMSVSRGSREPLAMRGVWFRGGDAVAQVEALDAALSAAPDPMPSADAPKAPSAREPLSIREARRKIAQWDTGGGLTVGSMPMTAEQLEELKRSALASPQQIVAADPDPLPLLLWCPECGARHLDVGEFATKPHHTHACQSCGHVWRPGIGATVGVQFLPDFKNADEPEPDCRPAPAMHLPAQMEELRERLVRLRGEILDPDPSLGLVTAEDVVEHIDAILRLVPVQHDDQQGGKAVRP